MEKSILKKVLDRWSHHNRDELRSSAQQRLSRLSKRYVYKEKFAQ